VVLIGFGEGFVIREALGNPSRTPQFFPQADDYQCPDRDESGGTNNPSTVGQLRSVTT
jgi:hypothetical protein